MRITTLVSLIGVLLLTAACYNQRPQLNCSTYEEASDPDEKNEEEWAATGRGLHLSFGSKDLKYAKGKVPTLTVTKDQQLNVWKGERVSLQAILWTAYDVEQVECVWEDLVSAVNDTLPSEIIQTRFVRYVMSDVDFVGADAAAKVNRDSCVIGDPLDELLCMDMDAKTVRPVWITINVPEATVAGEYKTTLTVFSKANPPQELRLTVNVLEQELPPTSAWAFRTHMNINPLLIAHKHGLDYWTDEHFEVLERYLDLMSLSGQKSIPSNLFSHDNHASEEEAYAAQTIKWIKLKNGQIKGDYAIFDKWVNQAKGMLNARQIDCYTYLPKQANVFVYYDQGLKRIVSQEISVDKNRGLIKKCLSDLNNHLKNKAWSEQAVMVIGEGEIDQVTEMKHLIQSVNSAFKLELVADKWSSELMEDVYAADVASQYSNLKEWFKMRHREGKETSYHITADNEYPNLYLHSSSAEAAWFGWYAAAQGIDGIHLMHFNSWKEGVLHDARLDAASSGSTHLIYPNARSTIRYERLIEGIQDYEKIRILRQQFLADEAQKEKLHLIDEILSDFIIERLPRESASQMVQNGQELLNQLSSN